MSATGLKAADGACSSVEADELGLDVASGSILGIVATERQRLEADRLADIAVNAVHGAADHYLPSLWPGFYVAILKQLVSDVCPTCKGRGEVADYATGPVVMTEACPECGGEGTVKEAT